MKIMNSQFMHSNSRNTKKSMVVESLYKMHPLDRLETTKFTTVLPHA